MDAQYAEVSKCVLCDSPVPSMYCDICHINVCKVCVGEHLSDGSKEHKVVPFDQRESTPKCRKHPTKICELHCEQCNMPICSLCVSSKVHNNHDFVDILKKIVKKKELIRIDLQELENSIYPKYKEVSSDITVKKDDLNNRSLKLKTALNEHSEVWHKEIDSIIQNIQNKIDGMHSQQLEGINEQEEAINRAINEIEQSITDIKKLLGSEDFYLVSAYNSRNKDFNKFPDQPKVTLPTFTPHEINRELIAQQFGSLSKVGIATEEHDDSMKTLGVISSHLASLFIDEPKILTDIKTEYGDDTRLFGVSCLSDNELWTRGEAKIMRLYNVQGKLLKSVKSNSGNMPWDIAVTQGGKLLYSDPYDRSINIVKNRKIKPLIKFRGWLPFYVCSASSGDFLVTMLSEDKEQTKVVRYSDSTEKQTIQWDEQGQPLFSSGGYKYLTENKNLDICVADNFARAIVVVNAAGRLRFRYTGPPTKTKKLLDPRGITTNSHGMILIADWDNEHIHILDQDGNFFRYIDNCSLRCPFGLCVDSNDNLYVAEYGTCKIKKIKYYK